MSDEIMIDRKFRLFVRRCSRCNRFHAHEIEWTATGSCADCKNVAVNDAHAREDALRCTINSLRGVITRLKRGRL